MTNPLTQAEETLSLTPEQAAAFFGYSRAQWYEMRAGTKPVPDRLKFSIEAHLSLPAGKVRTWINERLAG